MPPFFHRAPRALLVLASAGALALLGLFFVARAGHPFELEWQEGGMLDHAERVLAGEPLYVAPSLEFAPFPYPPLYHWLAAGLARLFGAELTTLRLLSIAATLATLALLAQGARRAGGGALAALAAAGLFAASYPVTGAWMDVARVDALFVLLLVAGFLWLRSARGAAGHAAAGALLAAAFLTKQLALVAAAPLLLAGGARGARALLALCLGFTLPAAGVLAILHARSEGWSTWTLFELLAADPWAPGEGLALWRELARALPFVLALAIWHAATGFARAEGREERARALLTAAFLAGCLAAAWIGRAHRGGYANTLLPATAALALLGGEAWGRLRGERAAPWIALILAAQIAWPLAGLDARALVPTAADRRAGESLVAELAAAPGAVLVPYHGYLAERAGSPGSAHAMAIIDLLASGERELAGRFVRELEAALEARRWSRVLLDDLSWEEQLPVLARGYVREPVLAQQDPEVFVPVSGAPHRPRWSYRPR